MIRAWPVGYYAATDRMTLTASVLQQRARTWPHVLAAALVAAACWIPAFNAARTSMKGLSEPYDLDQFRDLAAAQAVSDGRVLGDPFYAGETIWYNPLLPWTIAAVSRVRGVPVATAMVEAGPYLNALEPIALFAMVAAFFGPWPACLAMISLLYGSPHNDPAWASPAYSPWLFASNFASGLFYLALVVCARSLRHDGRGWWCGAGLALGIVFLAHTAPALVLGLAVFGIVMAFGPDPHRAWWPRLVSLMLLCGTAALVAAPVLWSIVGRYHLQVVNAAPGAWVWGGVASASMVLRGSVSARSAVAVIGLLALVRRSRGGVEVRLVLAWAGAAFALLAYGFFQRAVGVRILPSLPLPLFHFYFYLRAVSDVMIGVAVWEIVTWAVVATARASAMPRGGADTLMGAVPALLVCGFALSSFGPYRGGSAFVEDVAAARRATFQQFESQLTARLEAETPPDASVLASPENSLVDVAPAGRRVVAVPQEFSNPYVPFEPRARDQARLLTALMARDRQTFVALARMRGVTHVVLGPAELAAFDEGAGPFDVIRELSRTGAFGIFAVHLPDK